VVFVEVFKRHGVPIDIDEARGPMGAHKRTHIQRITELDAVKERWRAAHGSLPGEPDIDAMYRDFIPLQLKCLSQYSALIPGTLDAIAALRARGIKIGSTTGYDRQMIDINLADAAKQGYAPDATVCASDVPHGRPYPYMALANVMQLGVMTVEACVKVDDTVPGIDEGLNAGMWTIGFSVSGNEVGLSLAEWQALPPAEQASRRTRAAQRLLQSGAHYVVDSIAELMPCIDDIQARISRGERP
jgi:phosphonoacetaldehyde hydrolase